MENIVAPPQRAMPALVSWGHLQQDSPHVQAAVPPCSQLAGDGDMARLAQPSLFPLGGVITHQISARSVSGPAPTEQPGG